MRRWLFFSIIVLLAGAIWFGIQWRHTSLWYDETDSAYTAVQTWPKLWSMSVTYDFQSPVPLYFGTLKVWMLPFDNAPILSKEFTLRVLSVFFAFLSVAGILALGKALVDESAGVAASLLLMGLPAFVYIVFEVRAYGMVFAAFLWANVFLLRLLTHYAVHDSVRLDHRYRACLAMYILASLIMLYGHYTGLFAFGAHALLLIGSTLFQAIRRKNWLRPFTIGLHIALVVSIAYLPFAILALQNGVFNNQSYAGMLTLDQVQTILMNFMVTGRDAPAPLNGVYVILGLSLLVWLLTRKNVGRFIVVLSLAILPPGLLALVVISHPKLVGRYGWAMWPGLLLIVAFALTTLPLKARFWRGVIAVAIAGIISGLPWLTGLANPVPNSDLRGAFAYIRDHWSPNDLVVLRGGYLYTAAEFYQSQQPYIGVPDDPVITNISHILHVQEAVDTLSRQSAEIRGVWVVSWQLFQGDLLDPENIITGLLETIGSEPQPLPPFGDITLQYFKLDKPLTTLQLPDLTGPALSILPDALRLQAVQIQAPTPVSIGSSILIHAWWLRDSMVAADTMRVSVRLIGSDGKAYSLNDEAPAGWSYFPNRWPLNQAILGRYVITVSTQIPAGDAIVRLVLYSSDNIFAPVTVDVGHFTVVR